MADTILFVDDEAEMCFMVSSLFQHHGYKIMTAENADVALNIADTVPLLAIILDVNLGGEDGLKLMTFLHRNHPKVPIIIYTGTSHDESVVKKALSEGAADYIRKGGPMEILVNTVRKLTSPSQR